MLDEKYRAFLVDFLHADEVPHQDGNLFRHLHGTYTLLKRWKNPTEVCLAGLFHSIYGTVHFRRATLPFSQRRKVRNLIGFDAENLAYLFCVTNRPAGLIAQWGRVDIIVEDRYARDLVVLNRRELLSLLEIEAANLIDQRLWRHEGLQQLVQLPLSKGAKDDLESARNAVPKPSIELLPPQLLAASHVLPVRNT